MFSEFITRSQLNIVIFNFSTTMVNRQSHSNFKN